jgi:hypothetical protein
MVISGIFHQDMATSLCIFSQKDPLHKFHWIFLFGSDEKPPPRKTLITMKHYQIILHVCQCKAYKVESVRELRCAMWKLTSSHFDKLM